jgi:hypothetical protein
MKKSGKVKFKVNCGSTSLSFDELLEMAMQYSRELRDMGATLPVSVATFWC